LRLERAAALERGGDFEGAIAVYEALYAEDGEDLVIANNLASLLSAHREDAESLERAAAVARRLRGIEVPAFQDTWGWIESRRGNPEAALPPLEAAARGLPEDPLVRYHLGMTYLALGRAAAARTELETMLDLAGPDSALPQVARARAALAGLE
jgi:tetratricopeptide (TPR) repeat protein